MVARVLSRLSSIKAERFAATFNEKREKAKTETKTKKEIFFSPKWSFNIAFQHFLMALQNFMVFFNYSWYIRAAIVIQVGKCSILVQLILECKSFLSEPGLECTKPHLPRYFKVLSQDFILHFKISWLFS